MGSGHREADAMGRSDAGGGVCIEATSRLKAQSHLHA